MARGKKAVIDGGRTIGVYLGQAQYELLESVSQMEQTSPSDIIRRALRQYFSLPKNLTDSKDAAYSA